MSGHRHLEDADLLRAALERTSVGCAECDTRAAEELEFAARVRGMLAHESELDLRRGAALAERVLEATTRARVVKPRAVRPAARSPWKRVLVAAGVVAAVGMLPAVIWLALQSPRNEERVASSLAAAVEQPRGALPNDSRRDESLDAGDTGARAIEPSIEPPAQLAADSGSQREVAQLTEHETARAALDLERARLRSAAVPHFGGSIETLDGAARLLALRSQLAHDAAGADELLRYTPSDEDSALLKALWCEVALDRWVLTGVREPPLTPLLALLAREQSTAREPNELARLTLERADRRGALDTEARQWLATLRRVQPLAPALADASPIDDAWRAALGRALESEQLDPRAAALTPATARVLKAWLAAAD